MKMPKHRFRLFLLGLLTLVIAVNATTAPLLAQTDSALPADLIVSTGQTTPGGLPQAHNVLARLDAETGQVSPFYTDDSAVFLKALSWSPAGDRLAYLRVQFDGRSYSSQLCLLDQAGAPQGCFADPPVGYTSVFDDNAISWSADASRLVYVGGDSTARRLLEADVQTLETVRSVYEYALPPRELDHPPVLAWTDDLAYLTLGLGDQTRVQQGMPVLLVDLNSGEAVDLTHIPGAQGASLFVVCPYFSPQGTYLTAYNFDVPETPSQPQFLILNPQGAIVATIEAAPPLNALPTGCPAWQADEAAFYFPVTQGTQQSSTLSILKYSLADGQFSTAFASGQLADLAEATVISRLSLSPDGQALAFNSPFDPALNPGTQVTVIALTSPSPTLQRYSAPFQFSSDPLWTSEPVTPHRGEPSPNLIIKSRNGRGTLPSLKSGRGWGWGKKRDFFNLLLHPPISPQLQTKPTASEPCLNKFSLSLSL